MGLITKLQAINQMLLASGENLVADLEGESGVDTGIADSILEQVSLDFQLRGLANNKYIRKFTPDASGYIYLPISNADEEGLIAAELVSQHLNSDYYLIKARISNTGPSPKLWNITDNTDVWDTSNAPYYVEITMKLPWENLDTTAQRAILATAMRQYQSITQGDEGTDAFLGYQEQVYNIKGRAADINDKRKNIFSSSSILRDAAFRSRYFSDPNRFRYWHSRGI